MDTYQLKHRFTILALATLTSISLGILIPGGTSHAQTTPTYITPTEWMTEDITWTKANSPYVLLGDLVLNGATLTIEAGVVVKMGPDAKLTPWYGHLRILGTETDPVILTSLKDDTAAGDTNGDGNSSQPQPGDWYCTLIASCAMVKFGVHGVSEEDGVTKQPSKGEHHERHVDYNRICRH